MRGISTLIAAPWRSSCFLLCPSNLSDKTRVREVCAGKGERKALRKIPRGRRSAILGKEVFGEEMCLPGVAMFSRCRDFPEREEHERYPLDEARLRGDLCLL